MTRVVIDRSRWCKGALHKKVAGKDNYCALGFAGKAIGTQTMDGSSTANMKKWDAVGLIACINQKPVFDGHMSGEIITTNDSGLNEYNRLSEKGDDEAAINKLEEIEIKLTNIFQKKGVEIIFTGSMPKLAP